MERLYKQLLEYTPYNEQEAADKEAMLAFMERNPDCLSRENPTAHFTTSAWIVNKQHTKVLMAYHNIYNSWAWIGGHADGEAALIHVLGHEIVEETGLQQVTILSNGIFGINVLTVERHVKKGKPVAAHLHLDVEYLIEADDRHPLRIRPDENSAVGWVDIDKIDTVVTEEKMKPVYALLCEKMQPYL